MYIHFVCWMQENKKKNLVFKRRTNRCRSFECFCIVNRVNNAPMTRRIPQVNMVHFQIRRFVLIDWLPTDILLKTKSICLWENTASYRRAALSEIIPTATICKTRGPWATSLTWENSSNQETHMIIQTDRQTDRQTTRQTDRQRIGDQKSLLELSAQVS